jgi:hypothetical protein
MNTCLPLRAVVLALLLSTVPGLALAADIAAYDFAGDAPFIADVSGHLNHALATDATRVATDRGPVLRLGPNGVVRLPEGSVLLGAAPASGYLELSVCPEFDPLKLSTDVYDGWVVLAYLQKTSTNGLPDGYNEVGMALHGKQLFAKAGQDCAPFAVIDSPLREGQWTRLRLEWAPEGRSLYVDGTLAAHNPAPYDPPQLDACPGMIGRHATTGKWGFVGLVADFHLGPL